MTVGITMEAKTVAKRCPAAMPFELHTECNSKYNPAHPHTPVPYLYAHVPAYGATGHMMYFTFLWWMAALFCTLALLVGVPNLAINLAGE
jgi:hypothetical protein